MNNEYGMSGLASQLQKALNNCPTYDKLPENAKVDVLPSDTCEGKKVNAEKTPPPKEEVYARDYAVFDTNNARNFYFMVPGRTKDSVKIDLVDDTWLKVEVLALECIEVDKFVCGDKSFEEQKSYMVNVGPDLDLDNVNPSIENGILLVSIKRKAAKRRSIEIK